MMKNFTKYVLFLLAFIAVAQANIAPLKSSYDLISSEYGARYYDSRTSVWQSPDPILGEYMSGQTNGGVFNPKNLSLFMYTYNNPVNLVDPDGEAPDFFEKKMWHDKAVKSHINKLKRRGFTKFETEVRLKTKSGSIRIADIAAMKTGQTLQDAEYHEIKTVMAKEKSKGAKNKAMKLFKRVVGKVLKYGDLDSFKGVVRGASLLNQLKKDAQLNEEGGTIQRIGEETNSVTMNWNIYEYDNTKKSVKQKGFGIPVERGNKQTEQKLQNLIRSDNLK